MLAEIPLVGGELDCRLSLVHVGSSTKEGDLDLFLTVVGGGLSSDMTQDGMAAGT